MNDVVAPDYHALSRPLEFTAAAAAKVRELIAEEGNPELKLRVYIQGGGCSGFQYGFTFDEARGEDDLAVDNRRRDAAGRPAQPAVPDGRRDRLQRKPERRAVRDPQSEREDHLRLRQQFHDVGLLLSFHGGGGREGVESG